MDKNERKSFLLLILLVFIKTSLADNIENIHNSLSDDDDNNDEKGKFIEII